MSVSYTHLDVYKRQIDICFFCHGFNVSKGHVIHHMEYLHMPPDKPPDLVNHFFIRRKPVSYTHLDVYKRQE